ncbi:MAG: Nif3-like dinuclear metal center hexameric protein [Nanoarchaeota archaeon]|nr:Nif3-like dinuclear metal center hexameric protein [Nanoarchaeota archaeon]
MELLKVVSTLDEEFDVENVKDDWSWMFDELFVKKSVGSFRKEKKNTGLLIANSHEVNKIYTAFSPSRYVLEAIRMKGIANSLLVVKHPFDWDGGKNGLGFINFKERDYQLMESMGISIYSLHTPLDKNRNDKVVSTAYAFAKVIKMRPEYEFASDPSNPRILIGLIGKVNEAKLSALVKRINSILDYRVKLMKVTDNVGKVAIVTGGGFVPEIIQEAKDNGITTFITGVITPNASEYSRKNYKKTFTEVKRIGINIIGCSHYLTEKWAMEFSIPYFSSVCKAEFIEDKEALNLLE